MNVSLRIGTALSVVLLATAIGGCAASKPNFASSQSRPVANGTAGLATMAQAALMAGQSAQAIDYAERAVAATPADAAFRMILGNSYFAGGRFASAEAAYRDSLTLSASQPQVVLKLALVSIAQGKNAQAVAFLQAARSTIDPSDYGLGLALAGHPQDAANILRRAAEQVGADSRVRQNLALALALSGDWQAARGVAAQDVPGDQLDARIQSWMVLAKPTRASDQVASLTGISPAASDPGQPLRLALKDDGTRMAAAAPLSPAVPVAEAAPAEVAMQAAPVQVAPVVAAPVVAVAAPVERPVMRLAEAAPRSFASLTPKKFASGARPSLSPRAAALTDVRSLYRRASLSLVAPVGRTVVQVGAYASRGSVASAWHRVSGKFTSLRGYTPVAARYDGERGTVFRLSVQGFATTRDANAMCAGLKRAGASCFVRNLAGDAPVRIASL